MTYIDLTPRWAEILPTWLMIIEQAAMGECSNPDLVMENARKEMRRMAEAADKFGDLIHYLHTQLIWSDEEIQQGLSVGKHLRESDRHTVRESSDA